MKKLLKIFAVMFIVSVALLAVAAYVPNGDVADAVTADCTHEYSEVVLAQQPSCTQEGWLEHYTCTLCGKYFVKVGEDMVEVDREDISSPVLVHKWSDWFEKTATCTEEGGEMRYCALCGKTEHRGETIDATGHNLTHHEAVASTCEVAGNSEYWSCDRCGLYFSDGQGSQPIEENSWILPLAKHTEETIPGKAATCTETGLTDGVKCSVCGTVLVAQQEIPATGHNLTHHEAVASTCEVAGNSEYWSCDRCGLYFSDGQGSQPIEENSWILPLAKHTYGELIAEVSATCTDVGTKAHYKCSVCHKLFVDGESGKVEVSAEKLVIPTTEHTVVVDEAVEPTCTETGLTEGSHCSVCGTVLVAQQVIPATGHTVVTDEGKAPTCTETGLTEGSHCSVCNEVLVSQEVIPATGHTYDAVTTGNNVCTVCHQHEITQAEIVEKLYALESGKALGGTYLLTGIVTNVDGTNATIIVEEKEIYLYSFQSTDAFLVGDSVSVVGTLKHFDNYYEFDAGTVTEVTHPKYTLTFGANVEGYTVTLADGSPVPTSATNGTTYEVKITAPKGYKVANVTVNGTVVDMSESGTYSVTVCGETTVHVEIVSKMSQQEVALTFPDGNSQKISGYTNEWSVTLEENTWIITNANNNNNGWDYIRIGAKSSTSTSTISFTSEKSVSKIVVYTAYIRGSATATLSVVNSQGETILSTEPQTIGNGTESVAFDVSGAKQNCTYVLTFVCNNTSGSNGVIDISKVTYTSVVCEHEWGTWAHKSDATCTESATESRICELCGAEEVRTVGEPLGHTWGDWTSNGDNTHTRKCSLCGEKVTENCTFVDGKCEVCHAQEVVTHSVTVGYTVNGNAATTLPEGVTVEILGKNGLPVTDLANVVEGTITIKVTAEGFDIVVTCNDTPVTMDGGAGTFDLTADATLSVTLTTQTEHKGTAEDPYSVADALAIAGAIGQGNYTEKVYIKGLIVDVGSDRVDFRSNIYIADTADGTKMLVFSANFSEEVPSIYKGDTVVFHGYITNYEGILEIAPHGDYVYMTAVTRGSRPIDVQMENATTTLPDSAPIESTVTFTVTPDKGYEVVSVKVNGNFITPVEGTYSFVVGETNAVVVTTQVITTKHQVSVNGDVEGYTVTTDNGITLPGQVSEGTLKFTITAPAGYEVATVSVGDTVLTFGADGYYTTEVAGEITINITFSEIVVLPEENVIIEYSGGSTTNMTGNNDATIFGLDASIFNIHSIKNSGSVHVGLNKDGTIRLYKDNATTLVISLAEGYTITKIEIDSTSSSLQVKVDNTIVEDSNGQYVINASELSIENGGDSAAKINSIIVYYTEPIVCEHVVKTWTPNNGTHTGTCSLCGQEITEDCTYNEEHKCSVCGYAEPTRTVTVNFDETNESSTFGNYQWVNENGDVVEAPGDVYAGTVLYLKVSVNDYATHTISEVKATDTTLTVVSEDDGSKTYKFVVGTGDITITIAFEEAGATKTWKLVTANEQLYDGMQFVMVYKEIVAGAVVSNKYYDKDVKSVFGTDEITTLADTVTTFTLKASGTNWQIFDNVQQKYIVNGSTSNATLSWNADATTKHTIFSIDIVDGEAEIKCTTQTNQYLQYNASSPRFGNYKGTMQNVCIYAYM